MNRKCLTCGAPIPKRCGRGRPRDYCDTDCRQASLNVRRRNTRAAATAAVAYVRALPEVPPELEPRRTEHGGLL